MPARRRKKRAREPWGEFEVIALKEFYPRHGPRWHGWDEVLPSRTICSISNKANKLDLRAPATRKNEESEEDDGPTASPAEYERTVTRLMGEGLSPRQIDQRMHWVPGTTVAILTNRWKGDTE